MSSYLLDTNVVSEVIRAAPHPSVGAFFTEQDDLWLSSVVVHELEYGLQRLAEGRRRARLRVNLSRLVGQYEDRILPLDRNSAEWAATLRVQAERSGNTISIPDAFIAGVAKANDLVIATRNVSDFQSVNVRVFNPWGPS